MDLAVSAKVGRRITTPESNPDSYELRAAVYGQLGRLEEARRALGTERRLRPGISIQRAAMTYSTADPAHRQRYLAGLKLARLEE